MKEKPDFLRVIKVALAKAIGCGWEKVLKLVFKVNLISLSRQHISLHYYIPNSSSTLEFCISKSAKMSRFSYTLTLALCVAVLLSGFVHSKPSGSEVQGKGIIVFNEFAVLTKF